MRERRLRRVVTRAVPLTGITSYPAIATAPAAIPAVVDQTPAPPLSESVEALVVSRLAEPFEALRERADRLAVAGIRPTVFLAILGRPSETAALASEVRQVFASGGLATVAGAAGASPENAGAALGESRAEAACVCASAKTGADEIAAVARALKARGAMAVGLAGGGAPYAFDYVIGTDTDIVELLGGIIERIAAGRKESPRSQ
jgi:methylmalonyl-CoA mutase cobalamin-binding subunit